MKKTLLVIVFIFGLTTSVSALLRGYEGSVHEGIAGSFSHNMTDVSLSFVNGYRFNDFIFLGVGIGVTLRCFQQQPTVFERNPPVEIYPTIPIYGVFKLNLARWRVSPYILAQFGHVVDISGSGQQGFLLAPYVGVDFNIGAAKRYAITLQFGIPFQGDSTNSTIDGISTIKSVDLRLGFRF